MLGTNSVVASSFNWNKLSNSIKYFIYSIKISYNIKYTVWNEHYDKIQKSLYELKLHLLHKVVYASKKEEKVLTV